MTQTIYWLSKFSTTDFLIFSFDQLIDESSDPGSSKAVSVPCTLLVPQTWSCCCEQPESQDAFRDSIKCRSPQLNTVTVVKRTLNRWKVVQTALLIIESVMMMMLVIKTVFLLLKLFPSFCLESVKLQISNGQIIYK